MRYRYIAIEREFGSGGRLVASGLSEACGIPYYGQEILERVAKDQNISIERIQQYEETATNSFMYSIYMLSKLGEGDGDMNSREGNLLLAEQKAIRDLAGQGPGIFLGHCAGVALENKKGVLRVFIRASHEERIRRSIEEYQVPSSHAETVLRRFDKKRANYYQINTSRKWNNEENYDIVLDSGKIGIDGCIAALKGLICQ